MKVDVMVNGRPWKVALEPAEQAGTFTVTIKGKSRVVDASWIDADTAVADRRRRARARFGCIRAATTARSAWRSSGKVYEAMSSRGGRESATEGATGATGRGGVSAGAVRHQGSPMPGRVVRVLVAVGDRVTARQGVVVVEAMKMENELRTPRDGVVKEIAVAPGAAVETGAVLVVIEDQ